MKSLLLYLLFPLTYYSAIAQNEFTGIANYKITVEGSSNPITDSMSVIFGKQKVKITLYLPGSKSSDPVSEKVFIDDLDTKKSLAFSAETKTYKTDTLNASSKYDFVNTQKIAASSNNLLCFLYTADSTKIDKSSILRADCLAGIDYRNSLINNYYFLGIQPIIIDNRIVMDFIVTQTDGLQQRIYISDIKKIENVETYFDLNGYKPAD